MTRLGLGVVDVGWRRIVVHLRHDGVVEVKGDGVAGDSPEGATALDNLDAHHAVKDHGDEDGGPDGDIVNDDAEEDPFWSDGAPKLGWEVSMM